MPQTITEKILAAHASRDTVVPGELINVGIDMALALIADQGGAEAAGMVQLYTEYYPSGQRYGTAHQQPGLPGYLKAE